jgi:hypothetical protein
MSEDISISRSRSLPNAPPPGRVALDEGYVPKLRERVSFSSFKHITFGWNKKSQAKPKKHVYVWQCVSYRGLNQERRTDCNSADAGV